MVIMLKYIKKNKLVFMVIGLVFITSSVFLCLFFTNFELYNPTVEENIQLTPVMQDLLDELEKKFK